MYGNLATIIMVMVWLYICMNLLLYGAEINAYFEKEFRIAHKSVQELLAHEKEKSSRKMNEFWLRCEHDSQGAFYCKAFLSVL